MAYERTTPHHKPHLALELLFSLEKTHKKSSKRNHMVHRMHRERKIKRSKNAMRWKEQDYGPRKREREPRESGVINIVVREPGSPKLSACGPGMSATGVRVGGPMFDFDVPSHLTIGDSSRNEVLTLQLEADYTTASKKWEQGSPP